MSRRSWARSIGNPMTMFHDHLPSGRMDVKWSWFRVCLFGFWVAFLYHFPTTWGKWEWAALTTIALALAVREFLALLPVRELALAAAAYAGSAIADRIKPPGTTTVEVDKDGATKLEVTGGKSPNAGEDQPYGDMESGATSPEGQETQ